LESSSTHNTSNNDKDLEKATRPEEYSNKYAKVDHDEQKLRDALDDVLQHLSVPDLVVHLKAIRESKPVPHSIVVGDDGEEDLKSLVSRVTLPEDLCLRSLRNRIRLECHGRRITTKSRREDSLNPVRENLWNQLQPNARGPDNGDTRPGRVRGMPISFKIGRQIEKGSYSGGIVRGRPSGNGVVVFENKGMYIGEMKSGEMHGIGTLVFCDTVLRGDFEHNRYVV
jgi:hypothetical protein